MVEEKKELKLAQEPVLRLENPTDNGTDFEFREGEDHCWITVGAVSVHVITANENVVVKLFPYANEESGALAEAELSQERAMDNISALTKAAIKTGDEEKNP